MCCNKTNSYFQLQLLCISPRRVPKFASTELGGVGCTPILSRKTYQYLRLSAIIMKTTSVLLLLSIFRSTSVRAQTTTCPARKLPCPGSSSCIWDSYCKLHCLKEIEKEKEEEKKWKKKRREKWLQFDISFTKSSPFRPRGTAQFWRAPLFGLIRCTRKNIALKYVGNQVDY